MSEEKIYEGQPAPDQLERAAPAVLFFDPKLNGLTATMLRPRVIERVLIWLLCLVVVGFIVMGHLAGRDMYLEDGAEAALATGVLLLMVVECCIWAWAAGALLHRTRANRLSGWWDELSLTFLSPVEILQLQCAPTLRFMRRMAYCCGLASLLGVLLLVNALAGFVAALVLIAMNCYMSIHLNTWLLAAVASGAPSTGRAFSSLIYLGVVMFLFLGLLTSFGFMGLNVMFDSSLGFGEGVLGVTVWLVLTWVFKLVLVRVYVRHFAQRVYPGMRQS